MRAKKSLGQNFLTSRGVARDIVVAAQITPDDVVLEIGPGKGFLTEGLLQKAKKVIAVEKDVRMVEYLKDKFAQEIRDGKLELIHQDILSFDISRSTLHACRQHPLLHHRRNFANISFRRLTAATNGLDGAKRSRGENRGTSLQSAGRDGQRKYSFNERKGIRHTPLYTKSSGEIFFPGTEC